MEGFIVNSDFVAENADRPTVGNDVVQGEQEHMVLFGQAQKASSQEGTGFQVEGERAFGDGAPLFLGIAVRGKKMAEVIDGQGNEGILMNDLRRSVIEES